MSSPARPPLPFHRVNRRGHVDYVAGLQRHHLLPCQLLSRRSFSALFDALGPDRIGFDDFRRNGMLLPADDRMVVRLQLPMHRGPHRRYNAIVAQRVGQIEQGWSQARRRSEGNACFHALMRLSLLQRALRRLLLGDGRLRLALHGACPLDSGVDFTELDAMADAIWAGTRPPEPSSGGASLHWPH